MERHALDLGPFLEGAFRKFRKYNASAITISQSAADFYGTEAGQAIVFDAPRVHAVGAAWFR